MTSPQPKLRVLILDDDKDYLRTISQEFRSHGWEVLAVSKGSVLQEEVRAFRPDLLILDQQLKDEQGNKVEDGATLAKGIRDTGREAPILMLTQLEKDDGAFIRALPFVQDYLWKRTCSLEMIIASAAKAVSDAQQRRLAVSSRQVRTGELVIDLDRRCVTRGGNEIYLSPKLYGVLECLARNAGRPVHRNELQAQVWDDDSDGDRRNSIQGVVFELRKSIEPDPQKPVYITTLWGVGYRLNLLKSV